MTLQVGQKGVKTQAEARLVAEWLLARHAGDYYQTHVRLGSMPLDLGNTDLSPEEAKMVHNAFARWVDALVIRDDVVILVEAKVIAHPDAIGQLQLYARMLPFTPGLRVNPLARIQKMLVYAREDVNVSQLAAEQGITTEQFSPPWVDQYIATRLARQRQGSRPQQLTPLDGQA